MASAGRLFRLRDRLVADVGVIAEAVTHGGDGPARMLEYNADTPTSLYESASFQWHWLEDQIKAGAIAPDSDQFNGIHEALVARFREIFAPDTDVHRRHRGPSVDPTDAERGAASAAPRSVSRWNRRYK